MMIDSIPTMTCAYCGWNLKMSLVEDSRLPLCGPSIRIGFLCESCGQLEAPFPPTMTFSHAEN